MCAASFRVGKVTTLRLGRPSGRCARRTVFAVTITTNITGTGMLAKVGAGTRVLSEAYTYSAAHWSQTACSRFRTTLISAPPDTPQTI